MVCKVPNRQRIVAYEIEPMGEVARFAMTESHPIPIPDYMLEGGRRRWPVILRGLKSLLETGRVPTIPTPQPPSKPDQRSSHPIVRLVTLQSFLIDDRFQRRLEAGNIARVGAEIVRLETRHRTDVDSRLTGERP